MSGRTTYTFGGISIYRVLDGDTFTPWLFPETEYTVDKVLGGTQTYLDIGGEAAPPFSFRGLCQSAADRVALKALRGTTGTLTNSLGRSNTVTLVKASPVDGSMREYFIDVTFELRP